MKIRFNTVEEEWNEQAPKFLLRKIMVPIEMAFYIIKVVIYLAFMVFIAFTLYWGTLFALLYWFSTQA